MAEWFFYDDAPIRFINGAWLHGQLPLHPRVADLFSKNIQPFVFGNCYEIVLGIHRAPLEVDDTPYLIHDIELIKDQAGETTAIDLYLSDGRKDRLAPKILQQTSNHVLYTQILRHQLWVPAKFSRKAYMRIALLFFEENQKFFIKVADEKWPILSIASVPKITEKTPTGIE